MTIKTKDVDDAVKKILRIPGENREQFRARLKKMSQRERDIMVKLALWKLWNTEAAPA